MEPNYYQILGVEPTADMVAIKVAFRKKAMQCHPDRGGSHDEMILVNKAWGILSNPEKRQHYDEARTSPSNSAAQAAAAADAKQAQHRAEQYPRRWEDFESWLNVVAEDFAKAIHGSETVKGSFFPGFSVPTVEGSWSGVFFIFIGAILAGVFLSTAAYGFLRTRHIELAFSSNGSYGGFPNHIGFVIVLAPVLGGAWVGAIIHRWIGEEINRQRRESVAKTHGEHERHSQQGQRTAPPEPRIIACEKCGQQLRVPGIQSELLVTCPSCGHRFGCPAL